MLAERRVGLPAVAVALTPPLGTAQGVIEVNADEAQFAGGLPDCYAGGYFANCDVYLNAPASWADVVLRIRAINGSTESVLDMRAVADMQQQLNPTGNISGLLFSIRGKPASKFRVEAFGTLVDHAPALIYATAWGGPTGVYGDRATRLPVDLYAAPGQQLTYTTANLPLVAGGPVTLFDVENPGGINPTGDGIGITGITWTTDDGTARILTLQQRPTPVAVPVIVKQWTLGGLAGTTLVESFPQPTYGERGNFWELVLSAGNPVDHFVNVSAFNA